jgi:hypothetical protein
MRLQPGIPVLVEHGYEAPWGLVSRESTGILGRRVVHARFRLSGEAHRPDPCAESVAARIGAGRAALHR